MALKENAYLAVIVVLAVLVGAMGAYIYLQHTAAVKPTPIPTQTSSMTTPTTTATTPTTTTTTATMTTTTAMATATTTTTSATTTTTSTPTTAAKECVGSYTESYNESAVLEPPSVNINNTNMNTMIYVPFGTTATYYINIKSNVSYAGAAFANVTGTLYNGGGEIIFLGSPPITKTGTLGPGVYELFIGDNTNQNMDVTQRFKVTITATEPAATCMGTFHAQTSTLLSFPSQANQQTQPTWSYIFFVAPNTTGNLQVNYTSNATLFVMVFPIYTNGTTPSTLIIQPQIQMSGTYTLTGLSPGIYLLQIQDNDYPNSAQIHASLYASYSGGQ